MLNCKKKNDPSSPKKLQQNENVQKTKQERQETKKNNKKTKKGPKLKKQKLQRKKKTGESNAKEIKKFESPNKKKENQTIVLQTNKNMTTKGKKTN